MMNMEAFRLSSEKVFWRRRTLVLWEGDATVLAKSLT